MRDRLTFVYTMLSTYIVIKEVVPGMMSSVLFHYIFGRVVYALLLYHCHHSI